MVDMLVRLHGLPDAAGHDQAVLANGVTLGRARAFERPTVSDFARQRFSAKWASEVEAALSRQPVSCFIATKDKKLLGFACYETTMRGYFGPMGVADEARGMGLGKALLLKCLESMRRMSNGYAIIGGVGPREFYESACATTVIEGSDPGIYSDILP